MLHTQAGTLLSLCYLGGEMINDHPEFQISIQRSSSSGLLTATKQQAASGSRSLDGSCPSHLVLLSGHLGIWFHTSHLVIYLLDQLNSKEKESGHVVLDKA